MLSNHRISLDLPENAASITDLLNLQANDGSSLARLAEYLDGIAGGRKIGKVRMNTGAVQASGTVTFSSFIADDTVTLNGNIFTGKASPSGANQFAVGSSDEDCANNLAAKINASALDKVAGTLGASRRATVLLSSFVDADTVTINSVVFTGKTTPAEGNREQFAIGATDTITAANLAAAINNSLRVPGVVATSSSATVTLNYIGTLTASSSAHSTVTSTIVVVTSLIPGQIGNLCALAISAHGSVSGAVLTGGTEGTEVVFANSYVAV